VLEKAPSTSRGYIFTLFHSPHDASQRLWDGARTSHTHAKDMFGLDAAYPAINLASFLKSALPKYDTVFVDMPPSYGKRRRLNILQALQGTHKSNERDAVNSTEIFDAIGLGSKTRRALGKEVCSGPNRIFEFTYLVVQLAKFRAVKSPAEQALMHTAADISGRAHAKVSV
jgi:intermediate cleaving peptidase 55